MSHEDTTRGFFGVLEGLNRKATAAFCAEDCSHEDVPVGEGDTAVGSVAMEGKFDSALREVEKLVTTRDDTVLVERAEVWRHPTGEQLPLLAVAVCKCRGDEILLRREDREMKTLFAAQPVSGLRRMAAAGAS